MKKLPALTILFLLCFTTGFAQTNTLFDDSRLSIIRITIPADSLKRIYDSVLSDHYFMARFIFDDNQHQDTLDNVGFRLRGNTSRYSQKKSFKISFSEYVSGRKYQGVKKINLNGEHNDPTLIREKLFYDLWKKAGMVERRTAFVKLYINGSYYGLYTNLEEMEKEWLTLIYPETGGNLYKCSYPADMVYHGSDPQTYKDLENSTVTGGRVYELQTNKSADDYSRLVRLITTLNMPANESFAQEIQKILNVDHFLKALALDVATGNWDDYGYNKNNYYLYDNPADSLFDFITYDPDNTFGVDWFGIDWGTRDCRNWINRTIQLPMAQKVLTIPSFFNRYKQYLDTMANTVIHPDTVFPRIDAMKQLIQTAAEMDHYRTLDYGYTISDFHNSYTQSVDDHTPYGLKPFFGVRMQNILTQLHPDGISENTRALHGLMLYPNPAGQKMNIIYNMKPSNEVTVCIYTIYGKCVSLFTALSPPSVLETETLSPGIYFLQISNSETVYQAEFVKK